MNLWCIFQSGKTYNYPAGYVQLIARGNRVVKQCVTPFFSLFQAGDGALSGRQIKLVSV